MTRVVAVVGPTAAGKSAVGMEIARALDGEIVNADSRLFYRGMDIGTGKPGADDRAVVPHHLIDILEPHESLGLALFIERATGAIEEIAARGRLPVLVGGTGQYVWGLLEGWDVPAAPPDEKLRAELERLAEREGHDGVLRRLAKVDPEAAERIDARNVRRVIRAIEVARALGPGAGAGRAEIAPFDALVLGVTAGREELYRRIDKRIDAMIEAGWVDEVQSLIEGGARTKWSSFGAIGYREIASHLRGDMELEEAMAVARRATRRLVRQQGNWFRADDARIRWVESDDAVDIVRGWLRD